MSDRRKQLLFECYLTGQMSDAQWQEHLAEDAGLREYVSAHAPFTAPEPEPTGGSRERALGEYIKTMNYRSVVVDATAKDAFTAGWNARKQAEYEHALLPARDRWRDKL